jgi:hypothetical protein
VDRNVNDDLVWLLHLWKLLNIDCDVPSLVHSKHWSAKSATFSMKVHEWGQHSSKNWSAKSSYRHWRQLPFVRVSALNLNSSSHLGNEWNCTSKRRSQTDFQNCQSKIIGSNLALLIALEESVKITARIQTSTIMACRSFTRGLVGWQAE